MKPYLAVIGGAAAGLLIVGLGNTLARAVAVAILVACAIIWGMVLESGEEDA